MTHFSSQTDFQTHFFVNLRCLNHINVHLLIDIEQKYNEKVMLHGEALLAIF